jgi:2-polyprenyl-3-methyl-5-hydroxy-6-metoxy-1,4-benzoquinol methylase
MPAADDVIRRPESGSDCRGAALSGASKHSEQCEGKSVMKLLKRFMPTKAKPDTTTSATKDYYDRAFSSNSDWQEHYSSSGYYFLWTVILDRLRRDRPNAILEIGCGPGQLAAAIAEAGLTKEYVGIDFSRIAVGLARKVCPAHYRFIEADALSTDVYTSFDYDTVISTEFLEHVEGDLQVLGKLRPGTRVIATVPNFPYVSHVRHFDDADAVTDRYGTLFRDFSVATIVGAKKGTRFYLLQGTKA